MSIDSTPTYTVIFTLPDILYYVVEAFSGLCELTSQTFSPVHRRYSCEASIRRVRTRKQSQPNDEATGKARRASEKHEVCFQREANI